MNNKILYFLTFICILIIPSSGYAQKYSQIFSKNILKKMNICAVEDEEVILNALERQEFLISEINRLENKSLNSNFYCLSESEKRIGDCESCLHLTSEQIYLGQATLDYNRQSKVTPFKKWKSGYSSYVSSVEGMVLWQDGYFFIGTFLGGYPNDGLLITGDNKYYIGQVSNRLANGDTKFFDNGTTKKGKWKNGFEVIPTKGEKAETVTLSKSTGSSNCNNFESVKLVLQGFAGNGAGLKKMLEVYSANGVDFESIFDSEKADVLFDKYAVDLKQHLVGLSFSNFDKYNYTVNCLTIREALDAWRGDSIAYPKFLRENDELIKVTFYNTNLLGYEFYFYKIPDKERTVILQIQLLR